MSETKSSQESVLSLADRITDGSITADDLKKVDKLGVKELEAMDGFINWLAGEFHYQYGDVGYESPDAVSGTEKFKTAMEKDIRFNLDEKGWLDVQGINFDEMIKKAVENNQ